MRLAVALLLAGCASTVRYTRDPLPCQAQAMDLVWRRSYGRTDRAPDVWWVSKAAQNCGKVRPDGTRGFLTSTGACAGGISWRDGMDLVWYGAWERTALAHEAVHVVDARDGRPPDTAHVGPAFQPGGAMDQANAALAAARLCGP